MLASNKRSKTHNRIRKRKAVEATESEINPTEFLQIELLSCTDEDELSDPIIRICGSENDEGGGSGTAEEDSAHIRRCGRKRSNKDAYVNLSSQRKFRRNSGKHYISSLGHEVAGKQFSNDDCKCKNSCLRLLSEDERRNAFNCFWEMADFNSQNDYLCRLITRLPVSCRRPRNLSRKPRSASYAYYVQAGGKTVKVCKPYFLQTYRVSDGRVSRALSKVKAGIPGEDRRGKTASRKMPEEMVNAVKAHISSFPAFSSRHTRSRHPNRKYLQPELNVRKMYHLYLEWCASERKPVVECIYRKIFLQHFNLRFHCSTKDTCSNCDGFKAKLTAEEDDSNLKKRLQEEQDLHLRTVDEMRTCLKEEKLQDPSTVLAFTFSLQKPLTCPNLNISHAYYKQNLYCYNLSFHNLANLVAHNYVWDETVASRGSAEVASCVERYLEDNISTQTQVVMFSESCTGQNPNIKLVLTLLRYLSRRHTAVETVDLKFMLNGHSYLPSDSDFSVIEKSSTNKVFYTPTDWFAHVESHKRKSRNIARRMERKDFYQTANLEQLVQVNRNVNTHGEPVDWQKVRWIRLKRGHPFTVFYKESVNNLTEFSEIDMKPDHNQKQGEDLSCVPKLPLYQTARTITLSKKRDLIDLLQFIPPVHHQYYMELKVDEELHEEDIGPLDFYEECRDPCGTQ